MTAVLAVAAALLAPELLAQEGYRISPVDDTPRDSAFQSFANKLNKVAVKRDVRAFRKMCEDDIVTGTGRKQDKEEKGWAAFEKRWRPADGDSPLWETITDILSLGLVRMHPRMFVGPYLVWKFPHDLDPRKFLVLIRDQVALRPTPDRKARALAILSFDVVEKLEDGPAGWVRVKVGGKEGFVPDNALRSSLTPRAQFGQGNDGWKLIALEAPF